MIYLACKVYWLLLGCFVCWCEVILASYHFLGFPLLSLRSDHDLCNTGGRCILVILWVRNIAVKPEFFQAFSSQLFKLRTNCEDLSSIWYLNCFLSDKYDLNHSILHFWRQIWWTTCWVEFGGPPYQTRWADRSKRSLKAGAVCGLIADYPMLKRHRFVL